MRTAISLLLATVGVCCLAEPRPVWPAGRSDELNAHYAFVATFACAAEDGAPLLKVTAHDAYRVWLNGRFVGFGPVRTARGCARLDEWRLQGRRVGRNVIAIEASAYNCGGSHSSSLDCGMLLAEVVDAKGRALAATRRDGEFAAYSVPRERRISKYSLQRAFGELWYVDRNWDDWKFGPAREPLALEEVAPVKLLPRRIGYPTFAMSRPFRVLKGVRTRWNAEKKVPSSDFIDGLDDPKYEPYYRGSRLFRRAELKANLWDEMQRIENVAERAVADADSFALADGDGVVFDCGLLSTGFLGVRVKCVRPGCLYALFDELPTEDRDVNPTRLGAANVVKWDLREAGEYALEAFEPYEMKALKLVLVGGAAEVSRPYLRTYRSAAADAAAFACSDPAVNRIFEAARETYAQNAVDVFTDCPGRERAGWLCDSWFTARASHLLTGDLAAERVFLENYLLAEDFGDLPRGMVPMCYPSRFPCGRFIPNWSMWLVFELDEYLKRSGDAETVAAYRGKMLALADFFAGYENADGLLEKLPSWVFVEWSKANQLVQDVNYPSNMAYSRMLEILGRLYARADLAAKAERVRKAVLAQSWTGEWFCDNAVRGKDGKLRLSGERTEVCQYYAFFFGVATAERHPVLWNRLLNEFGPRRRETKAYPEIWPANAFIGNYLRLEILSRAGGQSARILDETKGFFDYMAVRTGTLWEYDSPKASCCHGFASHAAVVCVRDLLGLGDVDGVRRTVEFRPQSGLPLTGCSGSLPVAGGRIDASWTAGADGRLERKLSLPAGWSER